MKTSQDAWVSARRRYEWNVDLRNFKHRAEYPGRFRRVIDSRGVTALEDALRSAVDRGQGFEIAGEVCYWKNYGTHVSRDGITHRLLHHLSLPGRWEQFRRAVVAACSEPGLEAFAELRRATGQTHGFATPLTFMAFYAPACYPMVDKHIAAWWRESRLAHGRAAGPGFSQRKDGWIQTTTSNQTRQNWKAYLAWARFCRDCAELLGGWRARDVEMAVWTAQKNGFHLPALSA